MSRQSDFSELTAALKNDPNSAKVLSRLKLFIRNEAFTEGRVMETIMNYPEVIQHLYADFERKHYPFPDKNELIPLGSNDAELQALIRRLVQSPLDQQVFRMFALFNDSVLKTNFYKSEKIALSFRLDPTFLKHHDYPGKEEEEERKNYFELTLLILKFKSFLMVFFTWLDLNLEDSTFASVILLVVVFV